MISKTALIDAAAYIRMSSDQQDASPERQRQEIIKLAELKGFSIVVWFEDHGLTGTESANRPQFQRMLEEAAAGKFRAILMYEQSRFSREDLFEVFAHWALLKRAGVSLVTCQRGVMDLDTVGGVVTAIVDQHGAHDESLKIAARTSSGKTALLNRGVNSLGARHFGFDREFYDESGKLARRVPFREKFQKPPGWRLRFVPTSDSETLEAVRWAFDAALEGTPALQIGRELRRRGIKTGGGKQFDECAAQRLLRSAALCGRLVVGVGNKNRGKFRRIADGRPMVLDGAHPAIVSPEIFDRVQEALAARAPARSAGRRPFLLRGMVYCGYCGCKMYGQRGKHIAGGDSVYYVCFTRLSNEHLDCPRPRIEASMLEGALLRLVRSNVLTAQNLRAMPSVLERIALVPASAAAERRQLAETRERIAKATANLALAESPEDFQAVSKLIGQWRSDERAVLERIGRRSKAGDNARLARQAADKIEGIIDRYLVGDTSPELAAVLKAIVRRVSFRRRVEKERRLSIRFYEATVEFEPDVYQGDPIVLGDRELVPDRRYPQIADYVRSKRRAVGLPEIMGRFGLTSTPAWRQCKLAEMAGLILKVRGKGWIGA